MSLPEGWQAETPVAEPVRYRYVAEFEPGTEFKVTVVELEGADVVSLGLSFLVGDEQGHRHDYQVDRYEQLDAALDDADALIDTLTGWVQDGTIQSTNPDPETVGTLVEEFARDRTDDRVSRLRDWLRSLIGGEGT